MAEGVTDFHQILCRTIAFVGVKTNATAIIPPNVQAIGIICSAARTAEISARAFADH